MAGPGIRYYHLARVLSSEFDVVLAIPHEAEAGFQETSFCVVQYTRGDWASIQRYVCEAAVVISPSDIASDFPQLGQQDTTCLVVDGYDPLLAEWLALSWSLSLQDQQAHWSARMVDLNKQYLIGDFFICASERQRDWWLGLLEANGRVNAHTFRDDPSLRRLVDTVPFGLSGTRPQHTRQTMKGVWPGVGPEDCVILWGGGLWPWLDPLTAIRAIAKVWQRRQDVRLIFPGTRHPNPWMADVPTHNGAAIQTACDLGLLNEAVFFGDWVPYADWPNVLLESDIALTLHYDSLETRLAFRSRVLDYVWAGLPIVATRGDATSELVTDYGIGAVVEYEDVDGVAGAILSLLETDRESFGERFEKARQELSWERAARPLVEFCRHPRRAPDKVALGEAVGNPFYLERLAFWKRESERLGTQVDAYERGRFIRLMRWMHQVRGKLLGKAPQ
jgi:glycosyltransferase involved in cell wall biosynthesis